jgi:hypothetical protein
MAIADCRGQIAEVKPPDGGGTVGTMVFHFCNLTSAI